MWEFIGSKVEPGEAREQALIRECIPQKLEHHDIRRITVHEIEQYTLKIWRRLKKCLLKPITSWCVTATQR